MLGVNSAIGIARSFVVNNSSGAAKLCVSLPQEASQTYHLIPTVKVEPRGGPTTCPRSHSWLLCALRGFVQLSPLQSHRFLSASQRDTPPPPLPGYYPEPQLLGASGFVNDLG